MLTDILKNRLFRGALTFFVLCVVGSLLYMQHVERRTAREFAEQKEHVKVPTERQHSQPTTEAPVAEDPPQGGDVHEKGVPSHTIVSVEKPSHSGPDAIEMGLISPEEIDAQEKAKREFYASHGLEPPPPGYRYAKIGDGPPQLVKDKDPIINVVWGEGYGNYHQLTDLELARYSCLKTIDFPRIIKRYGLSQEEVELGLDWKQELYEKTKGPRPTITAHLSYPSSNPMTDEEKEAVYQRMRDREDELVPRPPEKFYIDYDVFDTIIAEIRETLSRR